MPDNMMVGDVVAEFLQQIGVTTAFGVISIHNIPMLDAIGRRNAIRFVPTRGEAGAGHMADGFARVKGGLGVLFTSTGPGAANSTGALLEAHFAGTPLLHITGQTATPHLGRNQGAVHDPKDQFAMLQSVSKAAYRVRSAESALGVLTRAAAEALTPPMGPVSVELPIDIQRTLIPRPAGLETLSLPIPPPPPGDPAMLDQLADIIAGAERPLLWTGNGAKRAGEAVARFVEMGVPVITSLNGRGIVPEDHPLCLGSLGNTPEVRELLPTLDLLIIGASKLRAHETADLSLPLPERRVQIDVDPAAEGRTYATDFFLCADVGLALDALADRLEGRLDIDPKLAGDVAGAKHQASENLREFLGAYSCFPGDLREAMPRDALWVRDITLNNMTWGHRIFPVYGPRDSIYPVGAAIGPGMQLGIGAALAADGRKVVAMCGDGGFQLDLVEVWTAAQEKADVVFLVMNDNAYGVIGHIQDTMYEGRRFYDKLQVPELEKIAELAGMPYVRVEKAQDMGPAVAEMLKLSGPSLVEVDMNAIGEFPRYFKPPPYVEKENEEAAD